MRKIWRNIVDTWIKFGDLLGDVMAVVILTVVYWGIVGPLAILSWIVRADFLRLRGDRKTYWLVPDAKKNSHDLQGLKLPF